VAQVVLGHVGADPHVVDRDQRHHRRAGLCEVADVRAQVGDGDLCRRTHLGVCQVELGLLYRCAGAAQLRVTVAAVAGRLLGLAQIGLGA
jgi:hypothetical protein